MRRAAKRDDNEEAIVDALRQMGASVTRLSQKGVPDLLIGARGCTYLAEIKERKGKLTPDQMAWQTDWRGSEVAVLRSVDQAVEWYNAITREIW